MNTLFLMRYKGETEDNAKLQEFSQSVYLGPPDSHVALPHPTPV